MRDKIYLSPPHMSGEGYEAQFVRGAFESNWLAPAGENVRAFERETAQKVGAGHAAALSSGTAALHLALKAAGVSAGDTVFCQSLTFVASANPIAYLGASPVFIGSDDATWNMDPQALEDAFKKYRPKAVVAVHLYGLSADLDAIAGLCRRYGAALVEDAAESLGTRYKGRYTGAIGDYGVYSFNGNKIITTAGGGMAVSGDGGRISKIRFWASQSKDAAGHYQHSETGYNYALSNVLAGIGRGQLMVLDRRVAQKRHIYDRYARALGGLPGVGLMPTNDFDEPNRWLSCITLSGPVRPADVIGALGRENIESRPVWKPLHRQPLFSGCDYVGGPVADRLFEDGVCLPSGTALTDDDLDRITGILRRLWQPD